jgi:hypothetical protein
MSTHENEVNRNIDTETAEGHRVKVLGADLADDTGRKSATVRPAEGLDDEAEGHRKLI